MGFLNLLHNSPFWDAGFTAEEQLQSNNEQLESNYKKGLTTYELSYTDKDGKSCSVMFQCRPSLIRYKQVPANKPMIQRQLARAAVNHNFRRPRSLDWSILDNVVLAHNIIEDAPEPDLGTTQPKSVLPASRQAEETCSQHVDELSGAEIIDIPRSNDNIQIISQVEVQPDGSLVRIDERGRRIVMYYRNADEALEDGLDAYEEFVDYLRPVPTWRGLKWYDIPYYIESDMCWSPDNKFVDLCDGIKQEDVLGYIHVGSSKLTMLVGFDAACQIVSEWLELFDVKTPTRYMIKDVYHIYLEGLEGSGRKKKNHAGNKQPKAHKAQSSGASSNGKNVNKHKRTKSSSVARELKVITGDVKTNKPHLARGFHQNTAVADVRNFILDEQRYTTTLPITIQCGPKGSMLLDLRDTFKSFTRRAASVKQQEPTTCLTKYAKTAPKSVSLKFKMLNCLTGSIAVMAFSGDEYIPQDDDVPAFIAARAMVKNSDCYVIDLQGKKSFNINLPVVGGIHDFSEQFVNIIIYAYTDLYVEQVGLVGTAVNPPSDVIAGPKYSLALVTCKYDYAGVYYAPRNVDDSQFYREIAIPYVTTTMAVAHTQATNQQDSTTYAGTVMAGIEPPSPPSSSTEMVVMSDAAGDHTADLFITLLEKFNPEVEPEIEHALRVVCNIGGMILPGWMTTIIDTTARVVNYVVSDNAKDDIAPNGLPDPDAFQTLMPPFASASGISSYTPTVSPFNCTRTGIYQNIMDQLPSHGSLTAGYKMWQSLVQLQQNHGFYPEVTVRNTDSTEPGMLAFSGFIPTRTNGQVYNILTDDVYLPSSMSDAIGPIPANPIPYDVQYGLLVDDVNAEAQLVVIQSDVSGGQDVWKAHPLPTAGSSLQEIGHLFGECASDAAYHVTFSFHFLGENTLSLDAFQFDPKVNTSTCFPWGVASAVVQLASPNFKFSSISDNHRVHYTDVDGNKLRSPAFRAADYRGLYAIRFNRYKLRLWDEAEHGTLGAPVGAYPLKKDLTICGDVEKNPGPVPLAAAIAIWLAQSTGFALVWDMITSSSKPKLTHAEAVNYALEYRYGDDEIPVSHLSDHALAHSLYRPAVECTDNCSLRAQICVDIMGASSERHLRFLQCLLIILSGDVETNPGPWPSTEPEPIAKCPRPLDTAPPSPVQSMFEEDIFNLRLKLMSIVAPPPKTEMDHRRQEYWQWTKFEDDGSENYYGEGWYSQYLCPTPDEDRPPYERSDWGLPEYWPDALVAKISYAKPPVKCPYYDDCPKRCVHCFHVPLDEIFTMSEYIDDRYDGQVVPGSLKNLQLNGTHGEYTCADDMGKKKGKKTTTDVPNAGAASSRPRVRRQRVPKDSNRPMTDREVKNCVDQFVTPAELAEASKEAKQLDDMATKPLMEKVKFFLLKPKRNFSILLGEEANMIDHSHRCPPHEVNLLVLARRHLLSMDLALPCCNRPKCMGDCDFAPVRAIRDVREAVFSSDVDTLRTCASKEQHALMLELYKGASDICFQIESSAIGGVDIFQLQSPRYVVQRSILNKLAKLFELNCCPAACSGSCRRTEFVAKHIVDTLAERKQALTKADRDAEIEAMRMRVATLRDEVSVIERLVRERQDDPVEDITNNWEYASRVYEIKALCDTLQRPCCVQNCRESCKRRDMFIEEMKKKWAPEKVTVLPSHLNAKSIDLNVQLHGVSGWPVILLMAIPMVLTFFYPTLWCYEFFLFSCCISLAYVLHSTTWYNVRQVGDLTPEQLEEIRSLSTPSTAPDANPLGSRKEKEVFQLPELRTVELTKRSVVSWVLRDYGVSELLLWFEERSAFLPLLFLTLTIGWLNLYILSALIIATTVSSFPASRRAQKLISLEAFTAYTSAEVITHGGTLESFKVECMRLTRTLNNIVLPSALSFMVTNSDNVLNMTLDIATLVFHHRKNEEEWCGAYLKQRAPRNNSILWVWLDMVQNIFLPLLHSLVPALHSVVLAATPLIMLHAMIQIVLPSIATQCICLVLALSSMGLRIRTQISEQHMMLFSELFTAFVAVCHRLTCRCRSDNSDDSPGGLLDETSDDLTNTSSTFMSGYWQRLTQMLRRLSWQTHTQEQLPLVTGLTLRDSDDSSSENSSDDSIVEACSQILRRALEETDSESETSELTLLLRQNSIPLSSALDL